MAWHTEAASCRMGSCCQIMENQLQKRMEHEMEAPICRITARLYRQGYMLDIAQNTGESDGNDN